MVTGDAPHGEHDHATTEPAIREILASLGLSASGLRWIESYSHSAWATDDVVVRYRIIGPTGRLTHEASVAAVLPPEALYPTVVASGCWGHDDWLVTERIPGESLIGAWPRMSVDERESTTHELARAVQALHGSPAQHLIPPCLFGGAPVVARSDFVATLADVARRASAERPTDACERVVRTLDQYADAIDDDADVMAHHDLEFGQCLWRDGHLVGVVDLEMAHANTADWDVARLLGMCADPKSAAPAAVADTLDADTFADVPQWFQDAYPAAFAHPSLRRRLRIYELVYAIADLRRNLEVDRMLTVLERGTRFEHLLAD
ncbi:MAG TPA: phosphotransferase [Acidimicrobiales bacterium]